MLETLKTLCAIHGVSGDEEQIREYIVNRITPHCSSVETDVLGNIFAFKKGAVTPSRKVMLCAHMDEVGVIVTGITDDGCLRFSSCGGIDRRVIIGKHVFFRNGTHGIINVRPRAFTPASERNSVPGMDRMFIDIGASNRLEAEKCVSIGDTAQFDPKSFEFGSGFFKAKAIDDRVGCAALIKLIESDLPVDCTFVFSVQEEVGTRGATVAAFRVRPDIALVCEGTTAADIPSAAPGKTICSPGSGVVIPFMDSGTIYSRELFTVLKNIAETNGMKWQTKTYVAGGTDAAAIQRSACGVQTAGIACALRNIHSPACVGKITDFDDMLKLAKLFLDWIGDNYK